MDILHAIKAATSEAERRYNAIEPRAARIAVAVFVAVLLLMLVWAILPWIGLVFAVGTIAAIALYVWPKMKGDH